METEERVEEEVGPAAAASVRVARTGSSVLQLAFPRHRLLPRLACRRDEAKSRLSGSTSSSRRSGRATLPRSSWPSMSLLARRSVQFSSTQRKPFSCLSFVRFSFNFISSTWSFFSLCCSGCYKDHRQDSAESEQSAKGTFGAMLSPHCHRLQFGHITNIEILYNIS